MNDRTVGLGTQLRRLLAELDGGVQAVYDEAELAFRPRFYPIMRALLAEPSLTVTELANKTEVSQPATTQSLRKMHELGLVDMPAGETDRRERTVRLTEQGRSLAQKLTPVWEATHAAAARLDAELPAGLSETIGLALAALERRSFDRRIRDELERKP